MNIILGASGQVGSAIVAQLVKEKVPVKGVIRNAEKAEELRKKGVFVEIADAFDLPALQSAFNDGSAVFILTPETGKSQDVLGETRKILGNYRAAIKSSQIRKVIGLSSIGAQNGPGSGNLEMSYLLEHAFSGMNVQQIFIRPAYYYSNWMSFIPFIKEHGILPTFYPIDLKIPMIAPRDAAEVVADVMVKNIEGSPIYEVEGPEWYNSNDVAAAFSEILTRQVEARQTPQEDWKEQLQQAGFTDDAARNFILMTELVIAGKAGPERRGTISIKTSTTLKQYLTENISH